MGRIAWLATSRVFIMVTIGAGIGAGAGIASAKYVQALLYGVQAGDLGMLALPAVVLAGAAILAALPAVVRAARIDPAIMLRAE